MSPATAPPEGPDVPDVDEISPVAQDHLKAIWSATEWGGPPTTPTALAARFGTSVANVTETMKRLAARGLVEYTRYRPVALTPRGEAYAVAMVRRHRLVETFLVERLGYGWDEVHDEAERLEHAVSDLLLERLDAALGHPAADPHGDPIPDARGRITVPEGAIRLADADPDRRWRVIRVSDADPGILAAADAAGILPGALVGGGSAHPAVVDAVWVVPDA